MIPLLSTAAQCTSRQLRVSLLSHANSSSSSLRPAMQVALISTSSVGRASQTEADALKSAEKMIELMASSPQMQQMMMASLPPESRSPEAIKEMLKHPGIKQKLVEMLAQQKAPIPGHVLDGMTPDHMEATFKRAAQMGLDPQQLFARLVAHPDLLQKLQHPRILAAFMDISRNPENTHKYANDGETMQVLQQIREALGMGGGARGPTTDAAPQLDITAQQVIYGTPPEAASSASSQQEITVDATFAESGSAAALGQGQQGTAAASPAPPPRGSPPVSPPGSSTDPAAAAAADDGSAPPFSMPPGGLPVNIMTMLMSDPELSQRLQNPKVQKALIEISKSPWKTIKYVFDREVMEVFSALNNMMRGKEPWPGKKTDTTTPPAPPTP